MFVGKPSRWLMISALLAVAACADIRKLTYPPEYVYIEKTELQSSMHQMAAAMSRLDSLVATESTGDSTQKDVLAQLNVIDQVAWKLSGGKSTNHLLLDGHMKQFSADVAKARLLASSSPPNYYYAGRLSGNCSGCHRFR
ncbi:MAG: hypothetical protein ACRBC3_07860 [Burkholderiaceae bacterium]